MSNGESFLDVDVSDATEPIAVDAGEYEIRITGGVVDKDKNGNPYFQPRFEVPTEATSKDFTDFIRLPYEGMSEKQLNSCKWRLKCFKECFGLTADQRIDQMDDLTGLTGWVILGKRTDEEYGEQNTIRKYLAPR